LGPVTDRIILEPAHCQIVGNHRKRRLVKVHRHVDTELTPLTEAAPPVDRHHIVCVVGDDRITARLEDGRRRGQTDGVEVAGEPDRRPEPEKGDVVLEGERVEFWVDTYYINLTMDGARVSQDVQVGATPENEFWVRIVDAMSRRDGVR